MRGGDRRHLRRPRRGLRRYAMTRGKGRRRKLREDGEASDTMRRSITSVSSASAAEEEEERRGVRLWHRRRAWSQPKISTSECTAS